MKATQISLAQVWREQQLAKQAIQCEGFPHRHGGPTMGLTDWVGEELLLRGEMREFNTGATRNNDETALDYEGFICPRVWARFSEYMNKHRIQADGNLRASDNWQKGIPLPSYMKSGFRHFIDWWQAHRGLECRDGLEEAICALIFNAQGYLSEVLKARGYKEQQCQTSDPMQLTLPFEPPTGGLRQKNALLAGSTPKAGTGNVGIVGGS